MKKIIQATHASIVYLKKIIKNSATGLTALELRKKH